MEDYDGEYFVVTFTESLREYKVDKNGNITSEDSSDDDIIEGELGNLTIKSTLSGYSPDAGTAVFAYDVKAVLNGETVYSNVATITQEGAGTEAVVLEGIPAKATVTVSQVYSGGYTCTGSTTQTYVQKKESTVTYTNQYTTNIKTSYVTANYYTEEGLDEWYRDVSAAQDVLVEGPQSRPTVEILNENEYSENGEGNCFVRVKVIVPEGVSATITDDSGIWQEESDGYYYHTPIVEGGPKPRGWLFI